MNDDVEELISMIDFLRTQSCVSLRAVLADLLAGKSRLSRFRVQLICEFGILDAEGFLLGLIEEKEMV